MSGETEVKITRGDVGFRISASRIILDKSFPSIKEAIRIKNAELKRHILASRAYFILSGILVMSGGFVILNRAEGDENSLVAAMFLIGTGVSLALNTQKDDVPKQNELQDIIKQIERYEYYDNF